jgi:Pregnancy-associated plasma protein-A
MTAGLPQQRICGTMSVHYQLLTTDLNYARNRQEIENHSLEYARRGIDVARAGVTVIPVAVHVVHNPSSPEQNISEAQIRSQIDVLNRDFRKQNPDIASIPAAFQPLAADARIQFILATTDPNGNPTNGITRTPTTATGFVDDNRVKSASTGGANSWPSDRYLNIWVCRLNGGLLGYAQFPGGPAATDGVVITHTGFGTTGTAAAPFNLGRTATHEIGHWLNLRHIWGDDGNGCNGSDFVDDTPNQSGSNTGRPRFPRVTCNNGPNGDMFMNYMDYTDDAGMFMFTVGQVVRMQAVLDRERASIGSTNSGDNLYQLHSGGAIWKYTGTPCSGDSCPGWQKLDNNPATDKISGSVGISE